MSTQPSTLICLQFRNAVPERSFDNLVRLLPQHDLVMLDPVAMTPSADGDTYAGPNLDRSTAELVADRGKSFVILAYCTAAYASLALSEAIAGAGGRVRSVWLFDPVMPTPDDGRKALIDLASGAHAGFASESVPSFDNLGQASALVVTRRILDELPVDGFSGESEIFAQELKIVYQKWVAFLLWAAYGPHPNPHARVHAIVGDGEPASLDSSWSTHTVPGAVADALAPGDVSEDLRRMAKLVADNL